MKRKTKPGDIRYSKIATGPTVTFIKNRSQVKKKYSKQTNSIGQLSKFGGLMILDAHQSALDIFASAASIAKHANFKNVIFPVTAYDYYFPFTGMFLGKIQNDNLMNILPIFRHEETLGSRWNKIKRPFFPIDKSAKQLNQDFLKQSQKALQNPHNVVLVSPYGGIKPMGSKVKRGVSNLLKTGAPAVCTWTKFSWKTLKYKTSLSSPIYFNKNSSQDYIQKTITSKFKEISSKN